MAQSFDRHLLSISSLCIRCPYKCQKDTKSNKTQLLALKTSESSLEAHTVGFIVCGFCVCQFVYSLHFVCDLQMHTLVTLCVTRHRAPNSTRLESPTCIVLAEVDLGKGLPPCFCSRTVNDCPFRDLFGATFFTFLCFVLVRPLF